MNYEEFKKLCEEFRAQGLKDEDILELVYQMFLNGDIDKEELSKLAGALGYEFTKEFDEFTSEKTSEGEAVDEEGKPLGVSAEEIEKAKEVTEESEPEDFEKKIDVDEDEEDEDDEDEKEEAKKLYGLKNN